jgi:hypothetical protein
MEKFVVAKLIKKHPAFNGTGITEAHESSRHLHYSEYVLVVNVTMLSLTEVV